MSGGWRSNQVPAKASEQRAQRAQTKYPAISAYREGSKALAAAQTQINQRKGKSRNCWTKPVVSSPLLSGIFVVVLCWGRGMWTELSWHSIHSILGSAPLFHWSRVSLTVSHLDFSINPLIPGYHCGAYPSCNLLSDSFFSTEPLWVPAALCLSASGVPCVCTNISVSWEWDMPGKNICRIKSQPIFLLISHHLEMTISQCPY